MLKTVAGTAKLIFVCISQKSMLRVGRMLKQIHHSHGVAR